MAGFPIGVGSLQRGGGNWSFGRAQRRAIYAIFLTYEDSEGMSNMNERYIIRAKPEPQANRLRMIMCPIFRLMLLMPSSR